MKFATAYNPKKTEPAPAGDKFEVTYEMDIDENGHKVLSKSERMENVYEKIQESLEETKIENIIRRALAGDETALAVTHGEYFDATNAPRSLAEAQQMIIHASEEFYGLPIEVREKFDHSLEMYVHEYGTETWIEKMKKPEKPVWQSGQITNEGGDDK